MTSATWGLSDHCRCRGTRREVDLSGGSCGGGNGGGDESGGATGEGRGCIGTSMTRYKGPSLTWAGREPKPIVLARVVMMRRKQGYPFDGPGRDDPGPVMNGNSTTPGNGGVKCCANSSRSWSGTMQEASYEVPSAGMIVSDSRGNVPWPSGVGHPLGGFVDCWGSSGSGCDESIRPTG